MVGRNVSGKYLSRQAKDGAKTLRPRRKRRDIWVKYQLTLEYD